MRIILITIVASVAEGATFAFYLVDLIPPPAAIAAALGIAFVAGFGVLANDIPEALHSPDPSVYRAGSPEHFRALMRGDPWPPHS